MIVSSPFKVDVPIVNLATFCVENFKTNLNAIAAKDLETGHSQTYEEVIIRSHNLVSWLTCLGLRRKDYVAVVLPNCIEFQIIILACLSAGIVLVPINHLSTADELVHYFDLVPCSLIITSDELYSKVQRAIAMQCKPTIKKMIVKNNSEGCVSLEECLSNFRKIESSEVVVDEKERESFDPLNDIAVVLFSSGTTGLSKGVMVTHHGYVSSICQMSHPAYECIEGSKHLILYQPMSHGYGFIRMLFSLARCKTTLMLPKFNLHSFLQAVETYKVKTIFLVPSVAVMLCKNETSNYYNLECLKFIYSSAAPMGQNLENKLKSLFQKNDIKMIQGYGMTECTTVSQTPDPFFSPGKNISSGCVGLLYANTEAKANVVSWPSDYRVRLPLPRPGYEFYSFYRLIRVADPRPTQLSILSRINNLCGEDGCFKSMDEDMKNIIKDIQIYICNITIQMRPNFGKIRIRTGRIVKPGTNEDLSAYEEGEILVRGGQVMRGYFNNVEATRDAIDEHGFLHTGDLGYYDENGFIFIKDRLKELIKHKGFQVAPAELESILMGHEDVADVAVVGLPDDFSGQCPQAWIVKKENAKCSEADIINWLSVNTVHFAIYFNSKIIEHFIFVMYLWISLSQPSNLRSRISQITLCRCLSTEFLLTRDFQVE
ncbi:hypothetical protein HELRODRAFT_171432 [Helobdella robusta]|uniref:AMP-dependent synthetase/ligase domain-containing protein n=1 Tax=Helobdella robusta TaxID=6412 RepID=T1F498_HELRO|nr:hypothetical protein HELRODRAFT_171432 [Helobdella robusta]ESO05762.1 hypothetical protein HELRODRAFT_171432 [Helobdella robusta]